MEQRDPRSLEELVDTLEQTLSKEALADLKSISNEQSLGKLHFSLGLYIRNHLIQLNDNRKLLREDYHKAGSVPREPDYAEAEQISQLVIALLWKRLQDSRD